MASSKLMKLKHYFLDNQNSLVDGFLLVVAIVVTGWLIHTYEAGEVLYEFTQQHEGLELDEIILILLASYFYLSLYTIRRYYELRRMVFKAHTDALVGIRNRGRGSELIRRELERLQKSGGESVLVMFDVDNFKKINDTHGHENGDVVLREIAATVSGEIREIDEFIRWGGEEFLVLCPSTSLLSGMELAERLRQAIARLRFDFLTKVTASFGVSPLIAGQSLREQIHRVDENLYASKRQGKDRVTGG